MKAPLSRISFMAAILVLLASLFQKQLAERLGHPMTEPTAWEKIWTGAKQVVSASQGNSQGLLQIPEHPVARGLFWAAIGIAGLALVAWILESAFWLPLFAMILALAAVFLKVAWLPALLALIKTTAASGQQRSSRTGSSTVTNARSRSRSRKQ